MADPERDPLGAEPTRPETARRARRPVSDAAMSGRVATLVLVVIAAMTVAFVLIGG